MFPVDWSHKSPLYGTGPKLHFISLDRSHKNGMDHTKTDLTTIFNSASALTSTWSHLTSFLLIFLEQVTNLVTPEYPRTGLIKICIFMEPVLTPPVN